MEFNFAEFKKLAESKDPSKPEIQYLRAVFDDTMSEDDKLAIILNKSEEYSGDTTTISYYTLVQYAADIDNIELLELLLENGAKKLIDYVISREVSDYSNIHRSALEGVIGMVDLLLSKGVDVNIKICKGALVLHYLVQESKIEKLEKLLSCLDFDLNEQDMYGLTPVQYAVCAGNSKMAELLFEHGSRSDGIDFSERNLLHHAAWGADQDTLELVLNKGNFDLHSIDIFGNTPLHYAARSGNIEIIKYFLSNGGAKDINLSNHKGCTPLYYAVFHGDKEILELLLENGAIINAPDNEGITPLAGAVLTGNLEAAKFLLEKGAIFSPELITDENLTILHLAAVSHNKEMIEFVLANIGNKHINTLDKFAQTALYYVLKESSFTLSLIIPLMEGIESHIKYLDPRNGENHEHNRYLWIHNEAYPPFKCHLDNTKELVELLLENGASVNPEGGCIYTTPLYLALLLNDTAVVETLLNAGADVNVINELNESHLYRVLSKNLAAVKALVEKGITDNNLNASMGCLLLHIAVKEKDLSIIERLLNAGVNINSTVNHNKQTALHIAVEVGDINIIRYLLSKDANLNVRDEQGQLPLHYATQADVINILLAHGADINAVIRKEEVGISFDLLMPQEGKNILHKIAALKGDHVEIIELLLEKGIDIYARDKEGRQAIHEAVRIGNIEIIKLLLQRGLDINSVDSANNTPMHVLLGDYFNYFPDISADEYRLYFRKLLDLLLEKGANIHALDNKKNTPLHMAAERGKLDAIEWLIEKGAEIDALDEQGRTPLFQAVTWGEIPAAEFLFAKRSNINIKTIDGHTIFHYALFYYGEYKEKMLKWVFAQEANVSINDANNDGQTPVLISAAYGKKLLGFLVENGADLDMVDKRGCTIYHYAIEDQNWLGGSTVRDPISSVKWLLEQNTRVTINTPDNQGVTPLHLAVNQNTIQIAEFLVNNGGVSEEPLSLTGDNAGISNDIE